MTRGAGYYNIMTGISIFDGKTKKVKVIFSCRLNEQKDRKYMISKNDVL